MALYRGNKCDRTRNQRGEGHVELEAAARPLGRFSDEQ